MLVPAEPHQKARTPRIVAKFKLKKVNTRVLNTKKKKKNQKAKNNKQNETNK